MPGTIHKTFLTMPGTIHKSFLSMLGTIILIKASNYAQGSRIMPGDLNKGSLSMPGIRYKALRFSDYARAIKKAFLLCLGLFSDYARDYK